MAHEPKIVLTLRLTGAERQTLLAWQRSTSIPAGRARRGRIILQLADGRPISQIATTLGRSRPCVYKWAKRFLQDGLEGLTDKPGRGRRRKPRADGSRTLAGVHSQTLREKSATLRAKSAQLRSDLRQLLHTSHALWERYQQRAERLHEP